MPLQIAAVTTSDMLLADWTHLASDVVITTNDHGYATLTALIALPIVQAFYWFDLPVLVWIEVNGNGEQIWRGRLEDVRLITGGLGIVALGAWSAFGDVPYTATPGTTTGDAVVKSILAAARAANPTLLHASELLIEAPGVSIYDEEYTDADMRSVLTRLAALGDSQSPPRQWEVGVWENEMLHFRPRGSAGRTWYTDLLNPDIERSLSQLINSVYARYDSGASVTATATDTESVTRYGVTRRQALSSRTSDPTQADRERDAALDDRSAPIPRATIQIQRIVTASDTLAPKYMVRSGDTLVIRNLPPETSALVDRIRTFRIAETRYTADTDTLEVVPESPPPSLDVLIAQSLEVPE